MGVLLRGTDNYVILPQSFLLIKFIAFILLLNHMLMGSFRHGSQICRSSRPEVFCKKGVLKNFTKFTGKYLCQSLFFNRVPGLAGLRPTTVLKKRLWHRCFPVNLVKFLRTPISIEHLCWLLLDLM